MSTNPPSPPASAAVPWFRSQGFTALWQQALIFGLGWLVVAVGTNVWDWRSLVVALLSNLIIVLKSWWSPTIVAPFAALNQKNV